MPRNPSPTKNDIIVIAQRCIDEYDGKLVKRLDAQDTILEKQNTVAHDQTLQLCDIKNQIREIYGNGSGKKGILDHMQETQATQAGVLATLQATVMQEKQAQELFRLEVRNGLKLRDSVETTRSDLNKTWIKWLKWGATPLGVAAWELIKSHFKIGEK